MSKKIDQEKKAPSSWRRFLKRIIMVCFLIIALPFILVPLYIFVPPVSMLMIKDLVTLKGYERNWVSYDEISTRAVYSIMVSEDARHCVHNGVDWIEMKKAWSSIQKGGRGRGASTITMQTVKNLFLWNSRSFIRKGLELPIALYADLFWSKRRTIEIYLNIAEWDEGVYGIDAAAQHYFNVPASKLTRRQAALLAVTLPSPIKRNPAKPTRSLNRLAKKIIARARAASPYVGCLKS
ncbi:MAG: monofunctional biosynthetic peptidoglycan transglycosylase [Hyphomicrobiales bacterium]